MRAAVDTDLNRQNLIIVATCLLELEYIPFYGTLLGLTRGGDIIEGDDDIDFILDVSERENVIHLLRSTAIEIDVREERNTSKYFLQGKRTIEGVDTYVDFYFFENNPKNGYLVEKWNFFAEPQNSSKAIHIPKNLIYPLKQRNIFGIDLLFPQHPELCCEFLYGKDWRTPRAKERDYRTVIIDNVPQQLLIPYFERAVKKIRGYISALRHWNPNT